MPEPGPLPTGAPFAPGSVSLRLYPHNELPVVEIVDRLCAMAASAADVGFDGVMTSEHHGGFAGYLPNPLQVNGFQLAGMTRGWAAAAPVLLPLRPVGLRAEEGGWLDARFPGRVGVGVGPGSLALDFEAMDAELDDAVPRFKRDLPRLAAMLRGQDLGPLEGDRALAGLAAAGRAIPVVSTALSPAARRRGAGPLERRGPRPDLGLGADLRRQGRLVRVLSPDAARPELQRHPELPGREASKREASETRSFRKREEGGSG